MNTLRRHLTKTIGRLIRLLVNVMNALDATAEISSLGGQCPFCEQALLTGPEMEYDQDGYSVAAWTCPQCGGGETVTRIPPDEGDEGDEGGELDGLDAA